jgi:hypothetical protein
MIYKDPLGFPKIYDTRSIQESYFYRNRIIEFCIISHKIHESGQWKIDFSDISVSFELHSAQNGISPQKLISPPIHTDGIHLMIEQFKSAEQHFEDPKVSLFIKSFIQLTDKVFQIQQSLRQSYLRYGHRILNVSRSNPSKIFTISSSDLHTISTEFIKFPSIFQEPSEEFDFPILMIVTIEDLFENGFNENNYQHQELLTMIKDKIKDFTFNNNSLQVKIKEYKENFSIENSFSSFEYYYTFLEIIILYI